MDSVTGNVELRTSDGDLDLRELISAKSELQTSDGEINISQVTGNLTLRSGDGDVTLGLINPDEINVGVSMVMFTSLFLLTYLLHLIFWPTM